MKYFSRSHYRGKTLRPPDLYECFVDNFWFKAADLEHQKINEPLRGSCRAMRSLWKARVVDMAPVGVILAFASWPVCWTGSKKIPNVGKKIWKCRPTDSPKSKG